MEPKEFGRDIAQQIINQFDLPEQNEVLFEIGKHLKEYRYEMIKQKETELKYLKESFHGLYAQVTVHPSDKKD